MRGVSSATSAFAPGFDPRLFLVRIRDYSAHQAHQGPLNSVVLALHIAKAEQRLSTLILIKVTVQLSMIFATRSNVEVKYTDIKGILYTNLPVTDFSNNNLGLMYEKIDPCWSTCSRSLPLLSGG